MRAYLGLARIRYPFVIPQSSMDICQLQNGAGKFEEDREGNIV